MNRGDGLLKRTDFFISYNSADVQWAEWVGWVLEENGFSVKIQAWDFVPGSNFALEMDQAATAANRTVAIVSPDYLKSKFAASEWAAAFARDPQGFERQLVPVRIRECELEGMLKQIVRIDLVGKTKDEAKKALLKGISGQRAKPAQEPEFPGKRPLEPVSKSAKFRGTSDANSASGRSATCPQSTTPHLTFKRGVSCSTHSKRLDNTSNTL